MAMNIAKLPRRALRSSQLNPGVPASPSYRVPQVAVLRDLCLRACQKTQVCEYADLWHPN
jgi:hypothetical protein